MLMMGVNAPLKYIVVYVDDDPDDLDLLKEAFEKYNDQIEVICFESSSNATAYLEEIGAAGFFPSLVILDVNMPMFDGKQTLTRLRQIQGYENIPVVLFSTSSLPKEKLFAETFKAGVITKPLSLKQMEAITDVFIDHFDEEAKNKIRRQKSN